jgi:hypothetical protein
MIIFEHTTATIFIWLGVALALACGAFSVWRFAPRTLPSYIVSLCYIAFLLLLSWCLLLPGRKSVRTETLKPRFVVALDTSKSMLLSPSKAASNRWSVAQQALALPWVKSVAAECEIDVYTFSSEVGKKVTMADLPGVEPTGESTLLREALQKITGRYAGVNVVGGLLLSDAVDTREEFEDWASEKRPFPWYTLRLEPEAIWETEPDVRVDSVNTPRRITVNWQSELKAMISGQGTKGQAVNVQLFKDNVLQQEIPTQIPLDGGARQVSFDLSHPEVGIFTYRVYVPPMRGESNTNDNEYTVPVEVLDAKRRLIYAEGPPRWESKYLKRALQADKQITPLIFVQGPDGKPISFGPVGSMTTDMTAQQLAYFKIVILGNLDASEIGERRANDLVKYVEDGGSLILLGGPKAWGAKGFAASPLAKILPVTGFKSKIESGEFPVALTDAGQSHPAFLGDMELWKVIPPVLSVFPEAKPSHAGVVLVVAKTPQGPQPIIVTQRYGSGKVVAIFTDSLWKWQLHPDAVANRPYQRFWTQMIAWLLPAEEDLDKEKIDIFVDRDSLSLGEEVRISARLGGKSEGKDAAVKCELTMPDKTKAPFAMRPDTVTTSGGKSYPGFITTYRAATGGLHTAVATATIAGKSAVSDPISFLVKPYSPESVPRAINVPVLKNIAQQSQGDFFNDLDSLNDKLASVTFTHIEEEISEYHSLWQHPVMIGLLMLAVTAGWITRKLNNMP